MDFLQTLADNSQFPLFTAFLLGLMTAISPCPLATNISAIGYISKDIKNKRATFLNGLYYTLGRAISYTILGVILIVLIREGSSVFKIQRAISTYGELLIGPLLLIIGIFMLDIIRLNFSMGFNWSERMGKKAEKGGALSSLLLGVIFALAFCPYSGILFFGGLIPLSVSASSGYFLPLVYALATGLPVIIFAYLLAYSVSAIGGVYNKVKTFEKWFRKVVAVVFILVGLYYIWIVFIR